MKNGAYKFKTEESRTPIRKEPKKTGIPKPPVDATGIPGKKIYSAFARLTPSTLM